MVVCHCRVVNDRAVSDAIRSGAVTPEDLADRCGAGEDCGTCLPTLRALLEDAGSPVA